MICKLIWRYAQYCTYCNVCHELNLNPRDFGMFLKEAKEDEK